MDINKLKDRGIIKWQGMMLPEHVELIEEWDMRLNKVPRPQLEEWEYDLISEEIERAYRSKSTIRLSYWRNGDILDDYGVPVEINISNKTITLEDPFSTNKYSFDEIVAASLID